MVELKDMQYEYALLSARVKLVRSDPTLLSSGGESRRFGPVYDRFMLLVLITIMYVRLRFASFIDRAEAGASEPIQHRNGDSTKPRCRHERSFWAPYRSVSQAVEKSRLRNVRMPLCSRALSAAVGHLVWANALTFYLCRREDTSDWLLTDKTSSWPGSPVEKGWRYLRQSLERHDGPQTDRRYTKVALETIMNFDRTLPPPPWLMHTLEVS